MKTLRRTLNAAAPTASPNALGIWTLDTAPSTLHHAPCTTPPFAGDILLGLKRHAAGLCDEGARALAGRSTHGARPESVRTAHQKPTPCTILAQESGSATPLRAASSGPSTRLLFSLLSCATSPGICTLLVLHGCCRSVERHHGPRGRPSTKSGEPTARLQQNFAVVPSTSSAVKASSSTCSFHACLRNRCTSQHPLKKNDRHKHICLPWQNCPE